MYTKFITVNRFQNQHDRLKSIKHLTRNLPDYHFETLQFLIRHLKVIVEHSEKNKVRFVFVIFQKLNCITVSFSPYAIIRRIEKRKIYSKSYQLYIR